MGNGHHQVQAHAARAQSADFTRTSGIIVRWAAARLGRVPGGHEWSHAAEKWAIGWEANGSDGGEMAPPIVIGELYAWLIDVNYAELTAGNPVEPVDGQQDFDKSHAFRWDPVTGAVDYRFLLYDTDTSTKAVELPSTGGSTSVVVANLQDDRNYRWTVISKGDDPGEQKEAFTINFKTKP